MRDAKGRAPDLVWLDALKGVAILWIVLNHVVERIAGGEFVGNPDPAWPPLGTRIAQFVTPAGGGPAGALATIVRDVGWLGDQGVTLFLIASGFGIAYGLARRGITVVDVVPFLRARAARIYPLWLGAHAVLLIVLFSTWQKIGAGFVLSALGIRLLPQTMYAFVPAWWYVGLLLQLYAAVPLIWACMRRFGAGRTFAVAAVSSILVRLIGLLIFHGYLDEWSRGAIFITRLPEFAFGMWLATRFVYDSETARTVRRMDVRLAALALFIAGFAAAFTLAGMAIAPFAMGVGIFVLLIGALDRPGRPGILAWTGRNSYPVYLVHQPIVEAVLPAVGAGSALANAVRIVVALLVSLGAARVLAIAVDAAGRTLGAARRRGVRFACAAALVAIVIGYGLLLAADLAALRFAPLEVGGWGERPSLEPDPAVGWKLIPSRTTRLRWTSYDYVVRSNALGFPAPEVAIPKAAETSSVLVTGDAFTSGEGVGTAGAWPSLLAADLAYGERRPVSVANFGITGYGPDQEARVVRIYAPRLRPNVVVFESFVNAFEKLSLTDDELRASIGFGSPPADSRRPILKLVHLRAFLAENVVDEFRERTSGIPSAEDAGFADASAFERDDSSFATEATAYAKRVRAARDAARAAGAKFLLVMIPSRSQVCKAADFRPGAFLDLSGATYDADRPQRVAASDARRLGVPFLDLRGVLKAAYDCPYQRENMHFLPSGQAIAARAVASAIRSADLHR